jgi:DNA-binding response OmpR family regulator
MKRILIIEDDHDIGLLVKHSLEKDGGFTGVIAADGETGLGEARRQTPDLVILDLNLPGLDGLDVCRQLRAQSGTGSVPIIMLTARVDESDKVSGLELGADDYVTKPFSVKELVARVRSVLRRSGQTPAEPRVLVAGVIELDEARRRVKIEGREVTLTRKEFDLLGDLMRHRGRVLSRSHLLERVWGYDHPGTTRTVDVHVRQLRKKLGSPADEYIETVVGVGYRLREVER